jgi:hypothetical protein
MKPSEIRDQARKLLTSGWHPNLVSGSVTHTPDQRSGLVDDAVWQAMKELQAEHGWLPTDPQPLSPPSW